MLGIDFGGKNLEENRKILNDKMDLAMKKHNQMLLNNDYIMEKGDGSGKQNILRWIHDHSECCGSGGAAKNGCPLTLDLESTGSKDMFFGAILFVLPILVTALQGV